MFTTYVAVTVLAAAANAAAAAFDFRRSELVLGNTATVGIPRGWLFPLGALKAAGALGLLAGIGVPLLGAAAAAAWSCSSSVPSSPTCTPADTAASPTRGRSCCWPRGRWRCGWSRPKEGPDDQNWTLTSAEPPPRAASLERWLALGGVAGPVLFVLAFTVAGMLRPGYSPIDQVISDLGIDEHAWIVNGSLVILGRSLVGLRSVSRSIRPRSSMALRGASAALLAAVGLGYAVAGIFPETNPLHWQLGVFLVYGGATLGFHLAGLLLRRSPAWRGWGTVTLLASLATLVLVGPTFYTFSFYEWTSGPAPVGQYGGLMERVLFIEILAWYAAVGWRLFRATGHGGPKDPGTDRPAAWR
jgi:hypothetical membrane protein